MSQNLTKINNYINNNNNYNYLFIISIFEFYIFLIQLVSMKNMAGILTNCNVYRNNCLVSILVCLKFFNYFSYLFLFYNIFLNINFFIYNV